MKLPVLWLAAVVAACSSASPETEPGRVSPEDAGSPPAPAMDGGRRRDDAAGSTSRAPDAVSTQRQDAGRDSNSDGDASTGNAPDAGRDAGGIGISGKYPGDVGIGADPAVVWSEGFEEGSVSAFAARYDEVSNAAGMSLVPDVPAGSGGTVSLELVSSGDGANATDFYKAFSTGYDEWYVRWYAKYQGDATAWHHTGTWFGGYNPPTPYPNPQAGLKPSGDDRISVSIEPVYGVGTSSARFDFYDYWMQMHSWMDMPSGDTAYYGNALVHQNSFTIDEESWSCIEVHVKLNTDPSSATGGVLEVWKNDALVQHFDGATPLGYWIKDKFCPSGADGTECTDYPAPDDTVMNLQWRSTTALQLNYFWPQNYITQAGVTGHVQFDDMVVATARVGCLQ